MNTHIAHSASCPVTWEQRAEYKPGARCTCGVGTPSPAPTYWLARTEWTLRQITNAPPTEGMTTGLRRVTVIPSEVVIVRSSPDYWSATISGALVGKDGSPTQRLLSIKTSTRNPFDSPAPPAWLVEIVEGLVP